MSALDRFQHRFADLPNGFYTRVTPQPLEECQWLIWNGELASQLGLPSTGPTGELQQFLLGELNTAEHPIVAMKYAGHQFGSYNPDLGDGRGMLLGELPDQHGTCFDIHLKGAGLTPYSRMGDGRAVLRSTIREYLGSEALAGLGVPTTRALGMFSSHTPVYREQQETGAMLLRATESHIRFGHFEHFFYTQQNDHLRLLADTVIQWYWPECVHREKPHLAMFERIIDATALMIAHWQTKGFTHGVMNTDNMSILGQTFDFGPYAFMDGFYPEFVPNHSDYQGRYSFYRQPSIALWNLSALGYALTPLLDKLDIEQSLEQFSTLYHGYFDQQMSLKLGLVDWQQDDRDRVRSLLDILTKERTDYTRFMRELSRIDQHGLTPVTDLFVDKDAISQWLTEYLARCEHNVDEHGKNLDAAARCQSMRAHNPKYVLRNYLAQQAISLAEAGDFSEVHRLAELLKRPYDEQPENQHYANLPPQWAADIEISCSS
ncbi:protein adenylyltransferase SelO [Vibrio ulleungensis]|uniref:Protein nucleotidyltransferase YdiU n=1 Tax=Vibrio ulleungensis TaxID=2807619 RepID=A0ABS2HG38_9VIBR|nr:YdiU family protein [Vibrio ulleungensis]MBM7035093.1 YdiU family protein [Vibrio ulleungensis]